MVTGAAAQYAENKNPKDRSLQTGESWRSLVQFFNLKPEKPRHHLLSWLFRFSALDDSPGNSLRRSLVRLTIEHRATGDYLGPETIRKLSSSSSVWCGFNTSVTQMVQNIGNTRQADFDSLTDAMEESRTYEPEK